jgi:hypothetical protein
MPMIVSRRSVRNPSFSRMRIEASDPQRLTETPSSLSPDGKRLAYYQWQLGGGRRGIKISTAPIEGDGDHPRLGKPEPFLGTQFAEWTPSFSPDGHWMAYSSDESGIDELYVRLFPGPGGKTQISTGGGLQPIWSPNRRQLFFLTRDLRIMVADYSIRGNSFAAGKPQVWSQQHLAFVGSNYPYDLAPDGKRFAVLMNQGASAEQAQESRDSVIFLLNFFDELRRKVPSARTSSTCTAMRLLPNGRPTGSNPASSRNCNRPPSESTIRLQALSPSLVAVS